MTEAHVETQAISSHLASNGLFAKLNKNELADLKKASQEKVYEKGELLFSKGEPGTAIWVVKIGRVHLQNVSYDGKVNTSCVMTPGEAFCCLPALDGNPYPTDAVAVERTTVLRIPRDFFRELLRRNPEFSENVICTFCHRLRVREHRACQATDPAELRLARLLLELSEKFHNEIPLTRQEIAEMAGLTVETTIRILSRMKKDGILRSVRKKTILVAPEELKELVME